MTLTDAMKKELIDAAVQAKGFAYSRHSNFPVGAALLTQGGRIIRGASIDNAAYEATVCAERVAIVKAVSEGEKEFVALAITSNIATPITPCEICRQVIGEFCKGDLVVIMVGSGGGPGGLSVGIGDVGRQRFECRFEELLPLRLEGGFV